jgi:hypothetical protein
MVNSFARTRLSRSFVAVECANGSRLHRNVDYQPRIAHYLIQSGPVIADGNTVGGTAEERILVHHRPSMIDKKKTVYKIVFEA